MYDTSILFSESVQNQINFGTWGCLDTETSYHSLIQRTRQTKQNSGESCFSGGVGASVETPMWLKCPSPNQGFNKFHHS